MIVGGSAIEFYTDGAYMSGDTDICWAGWKSPTMEEREEIMRQIPGIHGSTKSWRWEDLWIKPSIPQRTRNKSDEGGRISHSVGRAWRQPARLCVVPEA